MEMFTHAPTGVLLLLVIAGFPVEANAQTANVATVTEVQGTCWVRDNAQAVPTKARLKDKLRAGQEILCDYGGRLTITYDSSSGEKEVAPRWVAIGNAGRSFEIEPDSRRGGREASLYPGTKAAKAVK